MSFAKTVWQTLSAINVNDHTEKKGNLTYLSWAWAWGTLMENFPESEYSFGPAEAAADETVLLTCMVTVRDGEHFVSREMWLPVMDNRNKPIKNPDAFAINTTRMRCLTKCLAMFGLGHYIYAGEDLPEAETKAALEPISQDQVAEIASLLESTESDAGKFLAYIGAGSIEAMTGAQYEKAIASLRAKAGKQS